MLVFNKNDRFSVSSKWKKVTFHFFDKFSMIESTLFMIFFLSSLILNIAFEQKKKKSDFNSNTAYYRAIERNYNLDQRIVRDTIRVTGRVYIGAVSS